MTQQPVETRVEVSIPRTALYFVVAVGCAVGGYYLLPVEMWLLKFLAFGLLLTGVIGGIAIPIAGVGVGPCPVCGGPVEVIGRSLDDIECPKCGEYLQARKRRLSPMPGGNVADQPKFKVKLPGSDTEAALPGTITIGGAQDYVQDALQELLLVRRLPAREVEAQWPPCCCVCGAAPTRTESLAREVNIGRAGVVGIVERKLIVRVDGVPHCDHHEKGVALAGSPGECGRVLLFRSLDYRNAFRRANPWKIEWTSDP